ncbi:MAG: pyridoxine 5'-phosphate synthase, partial [Verrucomicrobia bacterium]|nr:pyridoxine 5'-phosphate synthase [Verrucomicrobiota bacterium]
WLAHRSLTDETADGRKDGDQAKDLTDHQLASEFVGAGDHHVAVGKGQRHRLLAKDILPSAERSEDDVLVGEVRGCHDDPIDGRVREDRRHIQDDDVLRLGRECREKLNLEMAATPAMLDFALRLQPAEVCLVPENRAEVTTEGGLDAVAKINSLRPMIQKLNQANVLVSLFLDPDPRQIDAAATLQAPVIELHTGRFADADPTQRPSAFTKLREASQKAHQLKIQVNAGHGLRLSNLPDLLSLPHLHTLNIGHSLVTHALQVGLEQSVRDFLQAITKK